MLDLVVGCEWGVKGLGRAKDAKPTAPARDRSWFKERDRSRIFNN